jgi:hypothetical protein
MTVEHKGGGVFVICPCTQRYYRGRKSRTSNKLRIRMGKDTTQRQERTADRLILHATSKHGRRQRVRKNH